MIFRLSIALIIFITGNFLGILCQEDSTFESEQEIENVIEESTLDNEDSQVLDYLEYLHLNPININSASLNDLLRIPIIDLSTALQIINYVKKVSKVFSINELYLIKEIDRSVLRRLLPFITVEATQKQDLTENKIIESTNYLTKFKINTRSRLLNDIQDRRGFAENKYLGSKYKIYNRFKLVYNKNIQVGFLSEKDAGEKSLSDFTAYHLAIKDFGIINKFVIGDYNLEFGQGLALSNPYGFSKGGNAVTSINKSDRNIIPYQSSDENQFFRGSAANFFYNNFSLTVFYSNHNLDASIDTITNGINSLVIDGYHRTESEIVKKQNAKEIFYGGRLDYSFNNLFSIGVLYYHSYFSLPLLSTSFFDIKGNNFNCYSFSYRIGFDNFFFSGETALNNSIATINSLQLKITENISTVILIRNYPQDYFPLHSSGFAESQTKNEFGIYTGINLKTKIGNFNFFFDQYRFPGATYYNPLPTKGREFYGSYEIKPIKKVEINLRYKNEQKEITKSLVDEKKIYQQLIQSIKTEVEYRISPRVRMKSRFDYINYMVSGAGLNENGYMIYQDIKVDLFKNFSSYARVIFFQTDSYDSRLYEYENDLPGVLSNFVLFGTGFRWYALVKYEIFDILLLSLKYSETLKPAEKTLGSGYQEIIGNLDNRISLQLEILL